MMVCEGEQHESVCYHWFVADISRLAPKADRSCGWLYLAYCHLQNTWHSRIDTSFCAHFGFELQSIVSPQWLRQSLQTLMKIEVLDSAQVTQAKTARFDRHFVISVSWCCHQALWISVYEQDFCSTNGSFNYHNIWSINISTMKLEWRTAVQQPWGYLKCSVWKCTSCAQF